MRDGVRVATRHQIGTIRSGASNSITRAVAAHVHCKRLPRFERKDRAQAPAAHQSAGDPAHLGTGQLIESVHGPGGGDIEVGATLVVPPIEWILADAGRAAGFPAMLPLTSIKRLRPGRSEE